MEEPIKEKSNNYINKKRNNKKYHRKIDDNSENESSSIIDDFPAETKIYKFKKIKNNIMTQYNDNKNNNNQISDDEYEIDDDLTFSIK